MCLRYTRVKAFKNFLIHMDMKKGGPILFLLDMILHPLTPQVNYWSAIREGNYFIMEYISTLYIL